MDWVHSYHLCYLCLFFNSYFFSIWCTFLVKTEIKKKYYPLRLNMCARGCVLCDITYWFVDYRFKASNLALWLPPSWFHWARSDHIWTIWCSCRWQALLRLYPDWIWLTTQGKAVIATSQSQGFYTLNHTLLYHLFYFKETWYTNWTSCCIKKKLTVYDGEGLASFLEILAAHICQSHIN